MPGRRKAKRQGSEKKARKVRRTARGLRQQSQGWRVDAGEAGAGARQRRQRLRYAGHVQRWRHGCSRGHQPPAQGHQERHQHGSLAYPPPAAGAGGLVFRFRVSVRVGGSGDQAAAAFAKVPRSGQDDVGIDLPAGAVPMGGPKIQPNQTLTAARQ